jgi:hypothetical protein
LTAATKAVLDTIEASFQPLAVLESVRLIRLLLAEEHPLNREVLSVLISSPMGPRLVTNQKCLEPLFRVFSFSRLFFPAPLSWMT